MIASASFTRSDIDLARKIEHIERMNWIALASNGGEIGCLVDAARSTKNGEPAIEKLSAVCEVVCGGKNGSKPDFDCAVKLSGRLSWFKKWVIFVARGNGTEASNVAKAGSSCEVAGLGSKDGLTPLW